MLCFYHKNLKLCCTLGRKIARSKALLGSVVEKDFSLYSVVNGVETDKGGRGS